MSSLVLPAATLLAPMPGPITRDDRREAIVLAAKEWISRHGTQTQGELAASEQGTPIPQQYLSWASRGEKLGPKMADMVAALYETTPDGLVYLFIRGGEWRALRDVPGWPKAKREAQADARGQSFEPWVWSAVDSVTVPAQIRQAQAQMVLEIARFLSDWGKGSGVILKAEARR